jgi:hypothetical protein
LNTGIGTKASPFLEKEGAPLAMKAGFRRAQLLPKRLAADCRIVTNFNEPPADDRGHRRLTEIPVEPAKADEKSD